MADARSEWSRTVAQKTRVQEVFGPRVPPIAIGFFDQAPAGVARYDGGAVAAGCAFWQKAQTGKAFYTDPSDHCNCAVGSYIYGTPLPDHSAKELEQSIGFMVENKYCVMDDVPQTPTLKSVPGVVVYGPADEGAFEPNAVVVAADPGQAMLLNEAVMRAGAGSPAVSTLGRTGCAVVPLTVNHETAAMSLGCQGNHTYTGMPQSELYLSIPGDEWVDVAAALDEVRTANKTLEDYYQDKLASWWTKLRWSDAIGQHVPWRARAVLRPATGGSR